MMSSTAISRRRIRKKSHPARPGTAAVELLLVVPLLIVLLFLLLNTLHLHEARQRVQNRAVAKTWHEMAENTLIGSDWMAWMLPSLAGPRPIPLTLENVPEGIPTLAHFPNRNYVGTDHEQITFSIGRRAFAYGTVQGAGLLIGPSWTYLTPTAVPNLSTQSIRRWYTELGKFANADLAEPLQLAGD